MCFHLTGSGDSGLSSPLTFVASPSSPGAPDLCDPSLTYIERVVAEVVDTEAVYVNDLRSIIEVSTLDHTCPQRNVSE